MSQEQETEPRFISTSVREFYRIMAEALTPMREDLAVNRRPKPDGSPGFINRLDPERKGFKASLVAIVFAGVFLESVLHLLIVGRLGIETAEKHDFDSYEKKLKLLGCTDPEILDLCARYRAARREVVHEKAYLDDGTFRTAQDEAEAAATLVEKIVDHFEVREKLGL